MIALQICSAALTVVEKMWCVVQVTNVSIQKAATSVCVPVDSLEMDSLAQVYYGY